MQRVRTQERPNWQKMAEEFGFKFHTMHGEKYWDESAYYRFSLREIENDLEDPTEEIGQMCREVVDRVVRDEALLRRFCIPEAFWQPILESWLQGDPSLYSRLDFAYDGRGPAKLYENNADTPTSLYETGFWQWLWLEDSLATGRIPASSDQFNSLQDKLVERFIELKPRYPGQQLHFACCRDTEEDLGTVKYLEDCARAAGIETGFVFVEDIGLGETGCFTDRSDRVIDWMFKLYPWEFLMNEEYGPRIPGAQVNWLEPMWKAVLSNKALLPMLWKMFPGHPNLLPAFFEDERHHLEGRNHVKKPIFSREGANVTVYKGGVATVEAEGPYGDEGFVYQAYAPLPKFDDRYALIGSWLVDDKPAGISVREDSVEITQDLSRYLPHIIS